MKKVFVAMFILIVFVAGIVLGAMIQREGIEATRNTIIVDEYQKMVIENKVVGFFGLETRIMVIDVDCNELDSELVLLDGQFYTVEH